VATPAIVEERGLAASWQATSRNRRNRARPSDEGRHPLRLKYVNEHLSAPLTLRQVAGVAYLSPEPFPPICFAEQTGMGPAPVCSLATLRERVGATE